MTKDTFMLIAFGYYFFSMILIVSLLVIMEKRYKKKMNDTINSLEREKNLIVSSNIISELNKVEALAKNEDLRKKYKEWQDRFEQIKGIDISNLTDKIIELQDDYNENDFDKLKKDIVNVEVDINHLKTKADFLLTEIREITLSEEKNRETIIKLKSDYREIVNTYKNNIDDYKLISTPISLQFENLDKLFAAFENAMNNNDYLEVGKIVKVIDDMINNLKVVISETKTIVSYGSVIIPKRIDDINNVYNKMRLEGYNLDYLNIEYNIEEANKKIHDIFDRLNVLNVVDSVFELKTILDYFDSLYNDFDKEKITRKTYDEYRRSIILNISKFETISNKLNASINEIKYSYDLSDEDVNIIKEIKEDFNSMRSSYDHVVEMERSKLLAYSKLNKEMEIINNKLVKTEEKLNSALSLFGGLKDDEKRAREQLDEIKDILTSAKNKSRSYKLPVVPKNYYVEISEATQAVHELVKELEKRPISIKTLNLRVDNARDLVLKVSNTTNETIKTAKMAEAAIVYGNRYRTVNKEVELGLAKAENNFYRGNFKTSLENAINAINVIEPDIYSKLLEEYK